MIGIYILLNFQKTSFWTSAPDVSRIPPHSGQEVAFVGRSNAGKSSALNLLTRQRNLARTSKTPGRTQLINLFKVSDKAYLVDLPGYGYARVAIDLKEVWQRSLYGYLTKRSNLRGLVLLMDMRHPLKELDLQMIELAEEHSLPLLILLTKADKLNRSVCSATFKLVRDSVAKINANIQVERFSSKRRIGLDRLEEVLDGWFLA